MKQHIISIFKSIGLMVIIILFLHGLQTLCERQFSLTESEIAISTVNNGGSEFMNQQYIKSMRNIASYLVIFLNICIIAWTLKKIEKPIRKIVNYKSLKSN